MGIFMKKLSSNLSEEGEVIPLSDYTNLFVGKQVLSIKQRDLYQSKTINLKIYEVRQLYEILGGILDE